MNNRGFTSLILIIIILIVVIGGGIFFYFYSQKPVDNVQLVATPIPTAEIQKASPLAVSNTLKYVLPAGWKEATPTSDIIVSLTSPDYVNTENPMTLESGINITIAKSASNENVDSFFDEVALNVAGANGLQKATLADQPAVYYSLNYEGFYDKYIFFKDGEQYVITIQYPDSSIKAKGAYRLQINQFLQSLSFQ